MGRLGLHLIGVILWASRELARDRRTPLDYVRVLAAHTAIGVVTVIGAALDRLPVASFRQRPRVVRGAMPVMRPHGVQRSHHNA